MKKILIIAIVLVANLNAWEINTHRAIDREAIEASSNLKTFVKNSGISTNSYVYNNEKFEGYGTYTYLDYIRNGETGILGILPGISNENWRQSFNSSRPSYQKMIEAGAILEDAQWYHSLVGRYLNHFYDAQDHGDGLWRFLSAKDWSEGLTYGTTIPFNYYSYPQVLTYFEKAFTEASPTVRKKYQAKMFVALGHLLHLMNDMTSPAHTRDDSHPFGDVMEIYGRGGINGDNKNMGFRISGNDLVNPESFPTYPDSSVPKYSKFSDFITKEAKWTATHFFSNDTIFTKPKPAISDTYESYDYAGSGNGMDKYYIKADGYHGIANTKKLGIRIKSYIINALREKFYTDSSSKIVMDKTTSFKGDYTVLEDNARILIPRAIANARNFLDYFFRGKISANIDGSNITIKNISDPTLVNDRNTVTIYPGTFHIKYTTRYDNTMRDFVFERDMDRYEPNIEQIGGGTVRTGGFASLVTLKPGESIVVAIKRDTSILGKNIVVIYDGIIGKERGLAICAASTPDAMRE